MSDFSMHTSASNRKAISGYLRRRQLYPSQSTVEPAVNIDISIVIPAFDEPNICGVLQSLAECQSPHAVVEVIVVLNYPAGSSSEAIATHDRNAREIEVWRATDPARCFDVVVLSYEHLPLPSAGVGLARKLGMDEALDRQLRSGNPNGVLVSLDADCRVSNDYLMAITRHYAGHPDDIGAALHFAHDLNAIQDPALLRAITEYELHLRYYVAGQRYSRFPYAAHTVGSAFSCRAAAYARQGGMNRRTGGEDFYFIQKLHSLGNYGQIPCARVIPEARISARVPFGTGPALQKALATDEELRSYPIEVFDDLRTFCSLAHRFQNDPLSALERHLPAPLVTFLNEQGFPERVAEIGNNVSSNKMFVKRMYRWFNAFMFLKYVHAVSDVHYDRPPVTQAAKQLLERVYRSAESDDIPESLLSIYRQMDFALGD